MKPLLRYLWIKTTREKFIAPILFTPLVMVVAPILGLLGGALIKGKPMYPFILFGETPARSLVILSHIALLMSALAGGVAAFWIFRQEIADRSIAAMVLATRPMMISAAGVLYGLTVGILSFALSITALSILTLAIPAGLGILFGRLIGIALVAAAVAFVCCATSPDPGLLLPMVLATFVTFLTVSFGGSSTTLMVGAAVTLAMPVVAAFLLEKRCAG